MTTSPKPINLDESLGFEPNPVIPTIPVVLFGKTWRVLNAINTFSISDIGGDDPASLARHLRNSVIEEERDAFAATLADQPDLSGEKLARIVNALLEVQAERPTGRSPGKVPSATKRTSGPKSAGR